MVFIPVRCLYGQSDQVTQRGKTDAGTQCYRGQNRDCAHPSFLLDPADRGGLPHIKPPVIAMSRKGRGIRETARVFQISTDTVIKPLKKRATT